ncbi:alcohol dehydrogenase [Cryptococcus wingfieldii CBS 7118]|uniref:Alcohol dehydrogenase n=1 Tax=Cryptococcus wingfieldii CBS 7118 TaxID=1295528 RepID=A0A1E3K768_9TREE|nr:alcohol dehydrogenase [Cryptococcus wingfieldii CBS 7118]ODO08766.1 alcohol dehydrogenase [Cryptococcus wingfieldii CBS 7118]
MKAFQVSKLAHPNDISAYDSPTRVSAVGNGLTLMAIRSDIPIPKADGSKGQVLLDVNAAALNFFDILQSQGLYQTKPPLPFVLGAEVAGTISKTSPIPEGCPFKPGVDRVFGITQGAYAEHAMAEWKRLMPIPSNLSMAQASTVPLTATTSYLGIVIKGQAKPGEWVLVHGAAGGVGLAACQIAKAVGCKVIAAASTDAKRQFCVDKGGVDEVVDYTKDGWQNEVKRITGGRGVDIVYDPVGLVIPSLKCVAANARILVIGFAGGTIEKIPANLLLLKQASAVGVYWGATTENDPGTATQVTKGVLKLLSTNEIRPVVHSTIYRGPGEVLKGLKDIENRKIWGKGVVVIREEDGALKAKL